MILENGKGPITGRKFVGFHLEGQIPVGQPEMIPGSRGPLAFRMLSIPGGGLEKSQPGSLLCTITAADKYLGRGYANLFFLLREERGLITQRTLKGCETRSRARKGVAGIFDPH